MLAIVHLSDIHFAVDRPNPISTRIAAISAAVAAKARDATEIAFVVSGDIAQSGLPEEYALAGEFFQSLETSLRESQGLDLPMTWIGVAGNHDCDHRLSNQLRSAAIRRELTGGIPDPSTLTLATAVLSNYAAFARKQFGDDRPSLQPLVHTRSLTIGKRRIAFQLIEAAWCSQFKEAYGELWLPQDEIRHLGSSDADITITVNHYPLNWFDYETRIQLRRAVDLSSQLVLTGHEHEPHSEHIIHTDGYQCQRIAAGELQSAASPHSSTFYVHLLDVDSLLFSQHTYTWIAAEQAYRLSPLAYTTTLIKRRMGTGSAHLEYTSNFEHFLSDLGMPISHPNPNAKHLDDFFVWPDLAVWFGKMENARQTLSSARIAESMEQSYVIGGADRAGKTSLGKQLVQRWRSRGIGALWIGATSIERRLEEGADAALSHAIARQYGAGAEEQYLQLPPEKKAVVVDDFHLLRPDTDREALLRALRTRFAMIVVLVNDEWITEQTASDDRLPELFSYKVARILPSGPRLRHRLTSKWVALVPSLRQDAAEETRLTEEISKLVDGVLGHDLVVPYPGTLLVILQTLGAQGATDVNHGSLGHTYHTLIHTRISAGVSTAQVNMRMRYLTELAWAIFGSDGGRPWATPRMESWHCQYVNRFNLGSEANSLPEDLLRCEMLDNRGGEWHFRHKYVYFYFVSEHITSHLHSIEIQEILKSLVLRLHNEDASNIFSFVAFKSRNEAVLSMLQARADSLFATSRECDIAADCHQLDSFASDVPRLVFEHERRDSVKEAILSERDGHERAAAPSYGARDTCITDEPTNSFLQELTTALRLVTVLGQVVRNHAGQLEANAMESLVTTTYSLSLRTLDSFFEATAGNKDELVQDVVAALKEKNATASLATLQTQASQKVIMMMQGAAYGILKHAGNSVGMGELMGRTLEAVRGRVSNTSVEIIDAGIDLDRSREYPRARVLSLAKRLHDRPFALGVFRIMCLVNFYIYRVPDRERQVVCEAMDIGLKPAQALSPRGKLPGEKVSKRKQRKHRKRRKR